MTDLGPEWVLDSDGVPSRDAARLIIFDADGRVLLIRGHDTHDLDHRWWFTVGGGLDRTESQLEGALREAREETGLNIGSIARTIDGPVMHRKAVFRFRNVVARQDEVFYIAFLRSSAPRLTDGGLTELENQTLDEFRWFTPEELLELSEKETVYPLSLPQLVQRWATGWDGEFVELGDEQDGGLGAVTQSRVESMAEQS
ncbi:NUDIX domain-containing protein [Actinomycetaceae bacterium MB13-C1-2]|nr:NUDIX domain-containing protein [Actinomycetaceae bacterium MB13-C1-2]